MGDEKKATWGRVWGEGTRRPGKEQSFRKSDRDIHGGVAPTVWEAIFLSARSYKTGAYKESLSYYEQI